MYEPIMVSLQKHVVDGPTDWRFFESCRINGKSRPVLYLGAADSLLERLLNPPASHQSVRSSHHGDVVMAMWRL